MSDRPLVLVLSNDLSPATSKISRHLGSALGRLGLTAVGRDTRLIRWAAADVARESPARREAYESMVVAKWNKFVFDYGFDTILGLDLNWLFSSQLFLEADRVKRIHSFWSENMRSGPQAASMFAPEPRTMLDLANHAKVSHHTFGPRQARELAAQGLLRISMSTLAAPAEFLEANEPCTEHGKIAFVGEPGLGLPATPSALAALEQGQGLTALQHLARQEILKALAEGEPTASWVRQCSSVADLLAAATERRLAHPQTSAFDLLDEAGAAYPEARLFLQENCLTAEACLLIKAVNRYDRLAVILRLWRRGWLDVHGSPGLWKTFGVDARPPVPFPLLASFYRRYPAYLHIPHFTRDGGPDEQPFEVAASGRLSINFESSELENYYQPDEMTFANSEEALEAAVEEIVRDSSQALAMGEKARERTAKEHLWEHRLSKALA